MLEWVKNRFTEGLEPEQLVPESAPEVEVPRGKAAETDAPVGSDDDHRPIDWEE